MEEQMEIDSSEVITAYIGMNPADSCDPIVTRVFSTLYTASARGWLNKGVDQWGLHFFYDIGEDIEGTIYGRVYGTEQEMDPAVGAILSDLGPSFWQRLINEAAFWRHLDFETLAQAYKWLESSEHALHRRECFRLCLPILQFIPITPDGEIAELITGIIGFERDYAQGLSAARASLAKAKLRSTDGNRMNYLAKGEIRAQKAFMHSDLSLSARILLSKAYTGFLLISSLAKERPGTELAPQSVVRLAKKLFEDFRAKTHTGLLHFSSLSNERSGNGLAPQSAVRLAKELFEDLQVGSNIEDWPLYCTLTPDIGSTDAVRICRLIQSWCSLDESIVNDLGQTGAMDIVSKLLTETAVVQELFLMVMPLTKSGRVVLLKSAPSGFHDALIREMTGRSEWPEMEVPEGNAWGQYGLD